MPETKNQNTSKQKQSETALTDQNVNDTIADVMKKKRRRQDLSEMFSPSTRPGEISRMLKQAVTISHWPAIDTNDPDQIVERIDKYHEFCYENDLKPDMSGMAMALGTTRMTLWRWENGVVGDKPQKVRDAIRRGREINEMLMVQLMQNGKINPVTGIFLLKNNHGYKDQQDVIITPNNPMEQMDPDAARKRLMESMPSANLDDDE